jgi:hypothetical protein
VYTPTKATAFSGYITRMDEAGVGQGEEEVEVVGEREGEEEEEEFPPLFYSQDFQPSVQPCPGPRPSSPCMM